jgi:hypothetical protein
MTAAAKTWSGAEALRRQLVPIDDVQPHPGNPRRGVTDTDRAYLAGILDGEGAIMLCARSKAQGWHLRVEVTNCDRRMLDWLAERWGGKPRVTWRNEAIVRPNWRTKYSWARDARSAVPVLFDALPYLVIKKRHAEVALEFAATMKNVGRRGHTEEVLAVRRRLVAEMKTLNRKGRP